ncbi:KEOPS complex subunit Cgi121 [Natrialba sp. SSL1]|uniref:KEOPS complex subunit Cgi121 n=1 Tax=Natrialba sp. SSL1 TaxID=1869245 RepID=UPI0008F8E009|nr:KEOPS complex subunit Cgi121 [Natrialba sp. SSL1]OIB55553.1 KEOPS complex component [Natrialba sp. SSL1]
MAPELLECRLAVEDLDAFVTDVGEIGERHGVTIQAFDARYVAGGQHLQRAVEFADRALERGKNVARDRAVEILLYAAGRRQIDQALDMGVSEGETHAVVLIDHAGSTENERGDLEAAREAITELESFVEPEPTLDDTDEKTLQSFFDITDAERAATDASLEALVRERVALLEVEK